MGERNPTAGQAAKHSRLRELRRALLRLHKILLDDERAIYERAHGRVSSGQLLQLVINHEQFAWLRVFSEFIVRVDEMFDAEGSPGEEETEALFEEARAILAPSASGGDFQRTYQAALQRNFDAMILHGEASRLLDE